MENCTFCKIITGEIEVQYIDENEHLIVIKDRAPKAPVHYLIIPKIHIQDIQSIEEQDFYLGSEVLKMAQRLSQSQNNIDFKLVVNSGYNAGQRVFHLHFHFLAGKQLGEV